jgi:predicted phosphate transport protein (TIGR00153 family)
MVGKLRGLWSGRVLVLPVETEQRVKRRALSICQDHLRKVLELTRKTPQIMDCFIKNDKEKTKQLFNEIRSCEEEVDNARRLVSQELAEIGAILLSREDFLRFTNLTSEIADFSEGIAFRIVEIMEHNWNVPMDIKKDLLKLSEAVLEAVLRLRETMMVLSYGSVKTMEKAKDVEIAEKNVDELYRELEIKLLSSKLDFPALILLRDVLQLLEDSADKAEDAADAARVLSFIM